MVDQSANAAKWVKIGSTYPTYWVPSGGSFPLILEVTNRAVDDCAPKPGTPKPCEGKLVYADAALFVPKNCEP